MKSLSISARFLDTNNKPIQGLAVRAEIFELASNSWALLGTGKTTETGDLNLKLTPANSDTTAPNIRLAEDGQGTLRVLAQYAQLAYALRTQALTADFGVLNYLGNNAYTITATQAAFSKTSLSIAALPDTPAEQRTLLAATIPAMTAAPVITAAARGLTGTAVKIDSIPPQKITEDLANANIELTNLRQNTSQLQLALSDQQKLLQRKDVELATERQEIAQLKNSLEQIKTSEAKLQKDKQQLEQRLTQEQKLVQEQQASLANANKAAARATDNLVLNSTPATMDVFNAELLRFKSVELNLQSQITAKELLLTDKDVALKKIQDETLLLKNSLAAIKESEAKLRVQNEALLAETKNTSPIENIAANIGSQVDAANKKLLAEKRPYQIQNIHVELRGALSQDGQSISLARMADMKEGLSSAALLRLDLTTNPKPTDEGSVKVPDISGLTETAVRRLLTSLGLGLTPVTQAIDSKSAWVVGQAVRQSPAAGTNAKHKDSILVVFAAAAEAKS